MPSTLPLSLHFSVLRIFASNMGGSGQWDSGFPANVRNAKPLDTPFGLEIKHLLTGEGLYTRRDGETTIRALVGYCPLYQEDLLVSSIRAVSEGSNATF
ncbi:hypothetical protein FB567DRAFT_157664 [Paraphoma chrysanthemicola]|uniref:Uncharacterized protein n=1 Tax=Paraphoma chrysanthemicola TaxID=798071 RepID=A0A8K0VTW6_9PLEO|nr:hypothetical protein FB567DRAFT_157664 [Paraphoma chrysanthemicola]